MHLKQHVQMLYTDSMCKYKSEAKRMTILPDHLVQDHGWTPEEVNCKESTSKIYESPSKAKNCE